MNDRNLDAEIAEDAYWAYHALQPKQLWDVPEGWVLMEFPDVSGYDAIYAPPGAFPDLGFFDDDGSAS